MFSRILTELSTHTLTNAIGLAVFCLLLLIVASGKIDRTDDVEQSSAVMHQPRSSGMIQRRSVLTYRFERDASPAILFDPLELAAIADFRWRNIPRGAMLIAHRLHPLYAALNVATVSLLDKECPE